MPYTIKVHNMKASKVRAAFASALKKDRRFTAELSQPFPEGRGARDGSRKEGESFTVTRVRLTVGKPYCGQHPGPCIPTQVPIKKKKLKYLEWNDWVEFNNLVNAVLDELHCDADVWSFPFETSGRMWIRKGTSARIAYDYDEGMGRWGPVRVWNQGTPDQFAR